MTKTITRDIHMHYEINEYVYTFSFDQSGRHIHNPLLKGTNKTLNSDT